MKKILLVFGTRPEAIKMAPLVKALQKDTEHFETRVCVTAQHRQMLDQVLEVFGITPEYDLNIMAPNQDLYDITAKVLLGLREVLKDFRPDTVLVHGDTTTSMAASLAAFYMQIPVGHVEAGLRTYNMLSPWPEEMNRQVTDRICTYYFAPTEQSRANLLQENIDAKKIFITGNTVIDALLMAVDIISTTAGVKEKMAKELQEKGYTVGDREYILVTGHRRENFGDGFLHICKAIKELAALHPEMDIVYPVHLNPNVQKPVYELLSGLSNVYLRFSRLATPVFHDPETYEFQIGKGEKLTDGYDIAVIATGLMTNEALRAAVLAKRQGLNVRVINMPTIKPIDEEIILTAARECGRIITVEEHSVIGGLGEAVCAVVSEKLPCLVHRIGVQDQFGHSGPANEVLRDYGLTAENIVSAIREIVRPDAK